MRHLFHLLSADVLTLSQVKRFSKLRVDQLINDTKCLKKRVGRAKSRVSNNTIYEKAFPGGMLIMVGTNAAGDLASTPAKIVFGDERDRHAKSAGKEGDPWELVRARQTTFKKDYKAVEVSSPTVKGDSNIVASYVEGTQALWCHQCPEYIDEFTLLGFPMVKVGTYKFYASAQMSAQMAQTIAEAQGGVPFISPSNQAAGITGCCLADGTEVNLSQKQANVLK